ncbi:MAG: phage major capsid protein [Patescibacteria group bacterium]|nr:phage major capsid protein [Patescibacteria group bacterium]
MSKLNSYSLYDFREQYGTEDSVSKLAAKMGELKLSGSTLFREFFGNTEASLMVPAQFLAQIVLGATSNPLFRDFSPVVGKDSGESIWIRRASDTEEAQVVNEGAEALIDTVTYEKSEFVYNKVMKRPMWSYEALADTPIDLIGVNNQLMGALVTLKEDQLGLADIYYWSSGARATTYANTVAPVAGQSYLQNLIDAVVDLPCDSDGFYKADVIIMNCDGYKLLLKDSNLPDAGFWGGVTFIQSGELSKILGCKIYVRTLKQYEGDWQRPQEVLTTDTDSTYIIDSRFSFAVIDRVPLTIDSWDIEARQLSNANIWERTILGILQPRAYRRLTAQTEAE